jgi:hypothetical protein
MAYTRKLSSHGVNSSTNGHGLRHVALLYGSFWPPTTVSSGLRATCQLHAELTTTIDSVLDDYHDEMRHRMTDSDDVVVFQPTTDQPFSFHIPTERIEDTVPLVASIFYKSKTTLVSSCSTKSPTGPKTTTLSSRRPQIRHQIRLSQT